MALDHSRDVRREDLRGVERLLVVGGGTSAAEAIEAWLDVRPPPGAKATLALPGPLRVSPQRILGIDVHYLVWPFELAPGGLWGARRWLRRDPVIAGPSLRRALRREVRHAGAPTAYAGDRVELAGGETVAPDLVVFATGYDHEAAHLGALIERDEGGLPSSAAARAPARRTCSCSASASAAPWPRPSCAGSPATRGASPG